jgi:hypothetical protein
MLFINRLKIPKWDKITVEHYQYINEINESDMDELDKVLYIITFLANSTEAVINKISLKTLNRLQKALKNRMEGLTKKGSSCDKIKGYRFNYDISKVTLGQYIEVQHFAGQGQIENLHLIAASICKKGKEDHVTRSEAVHKLPFLKVLWNVVRFLEEFKKLNEGYKGLFGVEDTEEDEYKPLTNGFNEKYGWIHSAKKVAEFEGLTLEQAFELPIIQALNDLSYLKALQEYENEISKRQLKEYS